MSERAGQAVPHVAPGVQATRTTSSATNHDATIAGSTISSRAAAGMPMPARYCAPTCVAADDQTRPVFTAASVTVASARTALGAAPPVVTFTLEGTSKANTGVDASAAVQRDAHTVSMRGDASDTGADMEGDAVALDDRTELGSDVPVLTRQDALAVDRPVTDPERLRCREAGLAAKQGDVLLLRQDAGEAVAGAVTQVSRTAPPPLPPRPIRTAMRSRSSRPATRVPVAWPVPTKTRSKRSAKTSMGSRSTPARSRLRREADGSDRARRTLGGNADGCRRLIAG